MCKRVLHLIQRTENDKRDDYTHVKCSYILTSIIYVGFSFFIHIVAHLLVLKRSHLQAGFVKRQNTFNLNVQIRIIKPNTALNATIEYIAKTSWEKWKTCN